MRPRISVRRFLLAAASLLLLSSIMTVAPVVSAADDNDPDAIEDLGEPVRKHQALGSAIGPDANGRPHAFFLIQGNSTTNSEFAAVDLRSRELVFDTRLPRGNSSGRTMAYSSADGHVYWGMGDTGELYRYEPGSDGVESLGTPIDGERIWGLHAAPDGTIWGGTYPGGRVFSYDPATGTVRDFGQAVEGQQYVHSLVQVGAAVYVGLGNLPGARKLARLDPQTGTFTTIPLPGGDDEKGGTVKDLYLRGGLLMATFEGELLVYDLASKTWIDRIGEFSGRGVSPVAPGSDNAVYFRTGAGCFVRYDLDSLSSTQVNFCPNAFPEKISWVDMDHPDHPGLSLAMTYWRDARIYVRNFESGAGYFHQPDVMGAGAPLTALSIGPYGDLYAGAYLSPPGMGRWNRNTKEWALLRGSGQVEGYGTFDGYLVFGRYPQATLYRFDPSRPWDNGTNPPEPLPIGYGQSRPTAFLELDDRVAVGSVPVPGELGGALVLWQPDVDDSSEDLEVFRHIVPDQTPVSLARHGGLIYGGTSIYGGYGAEPTQDTARLFVFDPDSGEVVRVVDPVPGDVTAISGLTFDEDGKLWGLAGRWLFTFDPDEGEVIRRQQVFAGSSTRYGDRNNLAFADGWLYAVTADRLYRVDPTTWHATVVASDQVSDLVGDGSGNLYFSRNSRVYRYDLPGFEATSQASTIQPGQQITVNTTLTNDKPAALHHLRFGLDAPEGWTVRARTPSDSEYLEPGEQLTVSWQVTAPDDLRPGEVFLEADVRYAYRGTKVVAHEGVVLTPDLFVARSAMSASATSESVGYEAAKAIDGDPGTMWHSQFNPDLPLPQAITIHLDEAQHVGGLTYLPRGNAGNGTITDYRVAVSADGEAFTDVAEGQWPATSEEKLLRFSPQEVRHVRLEALGGVGGFASAAEIRLLRAPES